MRPVGVREVPALAIDSVPRLGHVPHWGNTCVTGSRIVRRTQCYRFYRVRRPLRKPPTVRLKKVGDLALPREIASLEDSSCNVTRWNDRVREGRSELRAGVSVSSLPHSAAPGDLPHSCIPAGHLPLARFRWRASLYECRGAVEHKS